MGTVICLDGRVNAREWLSDSSLCEEKCENSYLAKRNEFSHGNNYQTGSPSELIGMTGYLDIYLRVKAL